MDCLKMTCLAILLVTFLGWLSDTLKRLSRLSDLQLRDQKVNLNHLVLFLFSGRIFQEFILSW